MLGKLSSLVLAVALLAAAIELPRLIKRGWKKEAAVYVLFLVAGVGLTLIITFKNNLPSPMEIHILIYQPIVDWLASLFPDKG
jgi:RsiW-degrading membrane proteinase PrsW (M82 family)